MKQILMNVLNIFSICVQMEYDNQLLKDRFRMRSGVLQYRRMEHLLRQGAVNRAMT